MQQQCLRDQMEPDDLTGHRGFLTSLVWLTGDDEDSCIDYERNRQKQMEPDDLTGHLGFLTSLVW